MKEHIYGVSITKTGHVGIRELANIQAAAILLNKGEINEIATGNTRKEVRGKHPCPVCERTKERK
jgi:hypothetical protein